MFANIAVFQGGRTAKHVQGKFQTLKMAKTFLQVVSFKCVFRPKLSCKFRKVESYKGSFGLKLSCKFRKVASFWMILRKNFPASWGKLPVFLTILRQNFPASWVQDVSFKCDFRPKLSCKFKKVVIFEPFWAKTYLQIQESSNFF